MGEVFSQFQVNRMNLPNIACLEYPFTINDYLLSALLHDEVTLRYDFDPFALYKISS